MCLVGYPLAYELLFLSITTPSSETISAFALGLSPPIIFYLFWILSIVKYVPRRFKVGRADLNNLSLTSLVFVIVNALMSYAVLIGIFTDGLLITVFHIITTIFYFFTMFYAGYLIKSAEINRRILWTECLGEFLMVWIFPVGIWVIQPRLNKLAE